MNDFEEKDPAAELLKRTAEQIRPSVEFANQLEKQLKMEHKSPQNSLRQTWQSLFNGIGKAAALAALAALLIWVFNSTQNSRGNDQQTQPAVQDSTPLPQGDNEENAPNYGQYSFRGGTLSLAVPLPGSPATLEIYAVANEPAATAQDAQELASRFGITGDVYQTAGDYPNTTAYVVSDGRQWLAVTTKNGFYYTADMVRNNRNITLPLNKNAEAIIREFLKSRGFDFPFSIEPSNAFSSYVVRPLTPNGIPMQFEAYSMPMLQVKLDDNGDVLSVYSSMVSYEQAGTDKYGIISAEEALQNLLDDTIYAGKIESMSSGNASFIPYKQWFREYQDGEPAVLYGSLTVAKAVDASKPALLLVDNIPVIGDTAGLDSLAQYAYVRVDGAYTTENGIRKFIVNDWMENDPSLTYLTGSLSNQSGSIILTTDQGQQYRLVNPPADLPLNTSLSESSLSINGRIVNGDLLEWTYIQFFEDASLMGGGGGGGGMGFYSLNLSGTPLPFPTPIPAEPLHVDENSMTYIVQEGDTAQSIALRFGVSVEDLLALNHIDGQIYIGQAIAIPNTQKPPAVEGLRGMLSITVFTAEDGTPVRTAYNFAPINPQYPFMELSGENLQRLNAYNNMPIVVWGSVNHFNSFGVNVLDLEKFEIPYPNLSYQIYTGTEKGVETPNDSIAIFTTKDGTQYAAMTQTCADPFSPAAALGKEAKETHQIQVEGLILPDASYAGYPVMCIYSSAPADGQIVLTPMAAEPVEVPAYSYENLAPSNLIIDSIELIYYSPNPRMPDVNTGGPLYIQPVWSFSGHDENGDIFNVLIQALKPEFLDPNLAPYTPPG